MDGKEKKKPNIVLYTIFMLIAFFIITELIIWGYGSTIILNSLAYYPQGNLVITEAILALLVLIVMLIFKNSYVFTQKSEKITKGLFYGIYYIIGGVLIILLAGGLNGIMHGGLSIINLIIGCFFIGVAEEFLCRGWLLNEFLERFGDTKKGVWYSIIVSGLIFGVLHFSNVLYGQDLISTITQVIGAAGTGIMFGIIYYKTKNIWSVILLHAFWDFSIYLSLIAPVTSTVETTSIISAISVIFTILMAAAELLNMIPYVKDIDSTPKKKTVILLACISIVLYLVFLVGTTSTGSKMGDEYTFDSYKLDNYSLITDNYEDYYIKHTRQILNNQNSDSNAEANISEENYNFKLEVNDDSNLVLTNLNTKYSIEFECEYLYDYIIMEEKDYFVLAYIDYIDNTNPFLFYKYIKKEDITNENTFMNNIKDGMKKYLLSDVSELLVINDREKDISYVTAFNPDYGYYMLISEDKMSILNRDE